MKNKYLTIVPILLAGALCSCDNNNNGKLRKFGDFSHNGVFLNEYAVKQINVDEAKALVDYQPVLLKQSTAKHSYGGYTNQTTVLDVSEALRNHLTRYGSLDIKTKYYVDGTQAQQVREDLYQGTDFYSLMNSNKYEPFGQMSVRFIFVTDGLLDYMEKENATYKESLDNLVTPFNDLYTYHTDADNNLILQTHNFAELPASLNGGVGATFRQDCEMIFDSEGKIKLWQSSLGLYTSTPTGTSKEGYIFAADFVWNEK